MRSLQKSTDEEKTGEQIVPGVGASEQAAPTECSGRSSSASAGSTASQEALQIKWKRQAEPVSQHGRKLGKIFIEEGSKLLSFQNMKSQKSRGQAWGLGWDAFLAKRLADWSW